MALLSLVRSEQVKGACWAMMKILLYVAITLVVLHGLIHVMGFVAYWPLAKVAELPYKTVLLDGRWEVGAGGMRLYGLLWLVVTLGFLVSLAGLFAHQPWWRSVLVGTVAVSTAIISLDWAAAFRGAIINAVILVVMALAHLLPGLPAAR